MGHEFYEIENEDLNEIKEKIRNKLEDDCLPIWLEPTREKNFKKEKQKALEKQDKPYMPASAIFKIKKEKAPEKLREKLSDWYKEHEHIFDGYHCSFRSWHVEVDYKDDKISEIRIGADAHI